jgi:hypothetical protein
MNKESANKFAYTKFVTLAIGRRFRDWNVGL